MYKIIRRLYKTLTLCIYGLILWWMFCQPAYATSEPYIIVIDPGHGGENLGAEYEQYTEKDMNMIVAEAMAEELSKYDNVIIYLTHSEDVDMSIKERADFAAEKNADFVFCLHFNASVHQNLYGSEVWIPAYGEFYAKGYQFAEIQMEYMEELGLYSRGIKTKLNDRNQDYYGILRQCSNLNIPSVLIEHCHLDHNNDKPFYQQDPEQLKTFGRLDAEAVAKYFGLKSDELQKDYSNYEKVSVLIPDDAVLPDKSEPEITAIELLSMDSNTGEITVKMNASDSDSYILYYKYSLDGGKTYSDLQKWPRPVWNQSYPEHTFKANIPFDKTIDFVACSYNGFDVWKESNHISIAPISSPADDDAVTASKPIYEPISYESDTKAKTSALNTSDKVILIITLTAISISFTLILFFMVRMFIELKNHKR